MSDSVPGRRDVLRAAGATDAELDELLAYTENHFDASRFDGLTFPLADEPHVDFWRGYAADAERRGFLPALGERLPQLRFPIEPGISRRDDYLAATRRGIVPAAAPFLALSRPDGVRLRIHPTIAGSLPVIVAAGRSDFEDLVRAFSGRNEPVAVPPSMGACIVSGFNNWDRVRTYRKEWEARHPGAGEEGWKAELARFAARKELYQDRFLILSLGPYSAVPASMTGFPEEEWQELSVEIRLEHECTHYFTWRVLGSMRDNLLDEIIADYAGLVKTLGSYRRELALLFFGLEAWPRYRAGGRLENYRGTPPLSDGAFAVLRSVVHAAIANIAEVEARRPVDAADPAALARRVVAFASPPLEQLASSPEAVERLLNGSASMHLTIHDQSGLPLALQEFSTLARERRLPSRTVSEVCIVLDELLSNVIRYGFDGGKGTIDLSLEIREDELTATIVDGGKQFDVAQAPAPRTDLDRADRPIGGLGIHLVRQLSDELRYDWSEGRNRVFLRRRISRSER